MKNNKVCFVIHSLQAGGMERVMSEIVNFFSETKKYEVHLILYGIERELFFSVSKDIIIHQPNFKFNNSFRLWSTIRTILFLRKEVQIINPVSVLTFGERWNNLVLCSLLGTNIPVFVSDRAQPDKSLGFIDDYLRKLLYPKAKGVIVQTSKALNIFQKKYGNDNFKVIGNPIRLIETNVTEKENYILMVGRFIESKQQDKLIEIFAKLNAPDWKLILLGYDHLKQNNQTQWEKLAKQLTVHDRVIFTGKLSDVEYYYNKSKIFAFTSASEGFPNAVGEAMSAGLPVVCFDCVAGPSDMITDGIEGYLIPLGNENLFGQKLQFLIDNPDKRIAIGESAKLKISQFEVKHICAQFENFIIPNQKTKTILFLYREIMPYNIEVLKELVKNGYEMHVFQDIANKLTSYQVPVLQGVVFYNVADFNFNSLKKFACTLNPVLVYISDRTIPLYNKIGIITKKYKIPVLSGNDTPWYGGAQWFNVFTSFFRHKRFFSHMIVAGMRQYEYAKKLGFSDSSIVSPLYSANVSIFNKIKLDHDGFQKRKDILFVGRFVKVKGLDLLIKAWQKVENKNGSKLILVGAGKLIEDYHLPDDIEVHPFSDQETLLKLSSLCKVFVLPSVFEPWGVVIHEFAAAGMPLIVSNACGAASHLVINNYNGYLIKPNDVDAIKIAISKTLDLSTNQLLEMGLNSRKLSQSIDPEKVAAAILSVI